MVVISLGAALAPIWCPSGAHEVMKEESSVLTSTNRRSTLHVSRGGDLARHWLQDRHCLFTTTFFCRSQLILEKVKMMSLMPVLVEGPHASAGPWASLAGDAWCRRVQAKLQAH